MEKSNSLFYVISTTRYILPFFSDCCPPVDPLLELGHGAGNSNIRVIRLTILPTPSHNPTTTATSTQSSSIAPSMYRGAKTFQTIRCRRSNAALTALPSSRPPKYCDVPRAARTAASVATRPWLFDCPSCPGVIPRFDDGVMSDATESGATFHMPSSNAARATSVPGQMY